MFKGTMPKVGCIIYVMIIYYLWRIELFKTAFMRRRLLFVFINLFLAYQVHAQWVISPGSSGGSKNVFRINAVDANVVWALDENDQVYRTINGGNTWNRFYLSNQIPGKTIYSFIAFDANTAYTSVQDISGWPWVAQLYKTTDGGNTWVQQPTAYSTTSLIYPVLIHFFDANNGVIVSDDNSNSLEISTTADGGNNWVKVPAANLPPAVADEDLTIGYKYAVVGNTIWFAAGGMRVFKSIDKGLTWTVSNTGIPTTGPGQLVSNVSFTDANNGIVNYIDTFKKTTDGGSTWTSFTPSGRVHTGKITHVPGLAGGYMSIGSVQNSVANSQGSSLSRDFGLTWGVIDSTYYHKAIAFSSPAAGWSGQFGYLLKYNRNLLGQPEDLRLSNNFTIAPNPGTGIFNITGSSAQHFTVEVYNIFGSKVLQKQNDSLLQTKINLNRQPKGVYLVKILSKGKVSTKRIVLQ